MRQPEESAVLITGCSTGIGRALVAEFARLGARVLATARNQDDITALEEPRVRTARLDVTDSQSISFAVRHLVEWAGRIDVLVNNAGYGLIAPVAELDLVDLRLQFETNLIGLVAVTQAVVPYMVDQRSGRIVNVGSVSGLMTTPFGGAYSASKAAVHMISDAMRMELLPFGINVITVQPGAVTTGFGDTAAAGVERYRSGSLYSAVHESVVARAQLSETGKNSPEGFAKTLVRVLTRKSPPAEVRLGPGSRILPILARLPIGLRDRLLSRRFGLDRLQ
jgi:NAD(P)-dependent dehydrogenase (short-subunit alcohol dehydrogenase family)